MSTMTRIGIRVARYLAVPASALSVALASAAVATAEPVWDLGVYDSCVAQMPNYTIEQSYLHWDYLAGCCARSGGVWQETRAGGPGKCVAPPAEGQSGRAPLSEVPTHVMTPSQPEQVPGGVLTPGG